MYNFKHFDTKLQMVSPVLSGLICQELKRQQYKLQLIASENYVSRAVLEAQGSILTNKYAEGYPGNRYYSGCEIVDQVEHYAIELACELFQCRYANVQPHSGSQANQAVMLALLEANDTILGMKVDHGGHLTHGSVVNLSGKWLNSIGYGVDSCTDLINMDEVEDLAVKHKPKLIIAGTSSYSRHIDWARFRVIADQIGAILLADISHFAGLIVGGSYPSPFPYADVVTTTTHKVLRGPRGGLILTNHSKLINKINLAVFPGLQGGPLMHVIAAKAVAFWEALQPNFKCYIQQVISNSRVLSDALQQRGFAVVSKGTDSHLVLLDLLSSESVLTGLAATTLLDAAGLVTNKNSIPDDILPISITSGLRLGSAACTTQGLGAEEFRKIAHLIADICIASSESHWAIFEMIASCESKGDIKIILPFIYENILWQIYHYRDLIITTQQQVKELCMNFPIYAHTINNVY